MHFKEQSTRAEVNENKPTTSVIIYC